MWVVSRSKSKMAEEKKEREMIEMMVSLREDLNILLNSKKNLIEQLNKEVTMLKTRIGEIDKNIGKQSIISAADLIDTEEFLKKKGDKPLKGLDVTRKIFHPKESTMLMCIYRYSGDTVIIEFTHPELLNLTNVCQSYIDLIIQPLMKLKDIEKNITINIDKTTDEGWIKKMSLNNVNKYEYAETIFEIIDNVIRKQLK